MYDSRMEMLFLNMFDVQIRCIQMDNLLAKILVWLLQLSSFRS